MDKDSVLKIIISMMVLASLICPLVFSGYSSAAVTDSDADVVITYQEGQWIRLGKVNGQQFMFQFPDGTKHEVILRASDTLGTLYYTADEQKKPLLYPGRQQGFYVCCFQGHFLGVLSSEEQGMYYTTLLEIGHPENAVSGLLGKCDLSKTVFTETGVTLQAGGVLHGGLTTAYEIMVTARELLSYEEKDMGVDISCAYEQYLKRDLCVARDLKLFDNSEEVFAGDTADSFFTIPAGTRVTFSDYKELNDTYSAYQIQSDEGQGWMICSQYGALVLQGADIQDVFSAEAVSDTFAASPDADPIRRSVWSINNYAAYFCKGENIDSFSLRQYGSWDEQFTIGFDIIKSDERFYTLTWTNDGQVVGRSCLAELPEGASDLVCVEGADDGYDGYMEIIQYTIGEQSYTSIFINAGLWYIPLHFCEVQPDGARRDLGIALPEQLIVITEEPADRGQDIESEMEETFAISDGQMYMDGSLACEVRITCTGDRMLEFVTDSGVTQWKLEDVNHLVRQ